MAKQIKKYDAVIFKDGNPTLISVDIHNLPYDEFNVTNPINIMGDVVLGKSKNHAWPDFTAVILNGSLDCSDFPITSKTVLPLTFKKLICKFSINDLGILIGRLPMGVSQVVVRTALLNNVRKNKDGALEIARRFIAAYPDVTVTDEKQTLADVIAEIDRAASATSVEKTDKQQTVEPDIATKTDEWLDASELVTRCAAASDEIAALPRDAQERYVRIARSAKARLNLKTGQFKRPSDGATVQCVHVDCVPLLVNYILSSIAEQEEARIAKDATKSVEKQPAKTVKPVQTKKTSTYFFGSEPVKPIKIKKYISKSAWGQIRAKVGNNTGALLRVLQDIEDINIDPAKAHTTAGQVGFIKDNQVQVSPTVTFKNGRCLTQGFGTLDDRPRLVWGICGHSFVCQDFFPAHEGKAKLKYNQLLREINILASDLDLSEYLLVSDLIKEFSSERPDASDVAHPMSPCPAPAEAEKEAVEQESAAAPAQPAEDVVKKTADSVPVEKKSRARIVRPKTEFVTRVAPANPAPAKVAAPVAMPAPVEKASRPRITTQKSEFVVSAKPDDAVVNTVPVAESQPRWVDMYSMHHELTERIAGLSLRQNTLMSIMMAENDTDKLLKMTAELQDILQQKQQCENAMSKLETINQTLQELQREYNQR